VKKMTRIACLAAVAAGLIAVGGGNARAASLALPAAGGDASFSPGLASWVVPALPSAAEIGDPGIGTPEAGAADLPVLPDSSPSEGVWIPILAVVLAGLVWGYLQSPEYGALYDRLYGPLSGD
jgi:hypothetical protein